MVTASHTKAGVCNRPVGVGELAVSRDRWETLVTYSLGSCVGLTVFDPVVGVAGLLHAQLPSSRMDTKRAEHEPGRFTDSGVMALLERVFALGASRRNLIAKAAGGSSLLDEQRRFRIGERNVAILRKILWKNDIPLAASDFGGNRSRTLYLHVTDGRVQMRSDNQLRDF